MIVSIFGDEPAGGVDDPAVLRMERAVRGDAFACEVSTRLDSLPG